MERICQKAQVLGATTQSKFNDLFRQKVQLEDTLKDVEIQIHYARGVLDTVGEIQQFIKDIQKGDEQALSVDNMSALPRVAKPLFGDDGGKQVKQEAQLE